MEVEVVGVERGGDRLAHLPPPPPAGVDVAEVRAALAVVGALWQAEDGPGALEAERARRARLAADARWGEAAWTDLADAWAVSLASVREELSAARAAVAAARQTRMDDARAADALQASLERAVADATRRVALLSHIVKKIEI